MNKKTIATYTLGCKVNQYETNAVEEIFTNNGYTLVNFEERPDIYIINTCTVTSTSDKKSRQIIRKAKKTNKDAVIVVIGCYAQNAPDEVIEIQDVNLVMGTKDKNKIFQEVQNISNSDKVVKVTDIMQEIEFENLNITSYTKNTRAFVKIQDGCDRYCSYCIIPYTRGRVRSRKLQDIVEEITQLSKNGYKEVVLTGIHIASYGKDFNKNNKSNLKPILSDMVHKNVENVESIEEEYDCSLIDVIENIAKIEGIKRIRIGSIEPMIINEDILTRLKKIDKFCPHFHLSLQSGCDDTLKRMNRRYNTIQYKEAVKSIREHFDNPAITTDIIVGFPSETKEEFDKTYEYLKELNLYEMHIFPFSRRSGTKAYHMPNQIDNLEKQLRSEKLIKLANENKHKFEKAMIDTTVEVLFEKKVDRYYEGHTDNYVKVYVASDEDISGSIKNIKIIKIEDEKLIGRIQ